MERYIQSIENCLKSVKLETMHSWAPTCMFAFAFVRNTFCSFLGHLLVHLCNTNDLEQQQVPECSIIQFIMGFPPKRPTSYWGYPIHGNPHLYCVQGPSVEICC